jgi:hypothetical protein
MWLSVNKNQRPEVSVDTVKELVWSNHSSTEKKWHLAKMLNDYYNSRLIAERKSVSENKKISEDLDRSNPKTKIWEYLALGSIQKTPVHSREEEALRIQLCFDLLTLGETYFDSPGFFKQVAKETQMQQMLQTLKSNVPIHKKDKKYLCAMKIF